MKVKNMQYMLCEKAMLRAQNEILIINDRNPC